MATENTILILEDESTLMEAIAFKLTKEGFRVITSRTVNQALSYLDDGMKVDMVWVDHYLLGDQDGLDFVTLLRSSKNYKELPVLVVSNTVTPEKVNTYLRLGIEKYYTKVDFRLDQ